jgi:hypothetical protein
MKYTLMQGVYDTHFYILRHTVSGFTRFHSNDLDDYFNKKEEYLDKVKGKRMSYLRDPERDYDFSLSDAPMEKLRAVLDDPRSYQDQLYRVEKFVENEEIGYEFDSEVGFVQGSKITYEKEIYTINNVSYNPEKDCMEIYLSKTRAIERDPDEKDLDLLREAAKRERDFQKKRLGLTD